MVSFTLVPEKVTEQIILEAVSIHLKDKKVTAGSQHAFMKGKSCLTNLVAFSAEMTGLVDERRAVDIFYLDFSKAFNTVSHHILVDKLINCGLDKWTLRWTENWSNC